MNPKHHSPSVDGACRGRASCVTARGMKPQIRPRPTPRPTRPTRPKPAPQFYSDSEAAAILAVSPSMIRKLRRLGKLEHVYIGRAVRISAAALQAFIDGLRGAQ